MHYVVIVIRGIVIDLFTVQNCGLRKLVECAPQRMLGPFTTNFYVKITSCQQTSWLLKGYAWSAWQFHVASHSIPQDSPPSNLPVLLPLPLPSELTLEENSLYNLPLLRTCIKLPLSSPLIETPLPTHIESLHFLSNLCSKLTPAAANIFSMEDNFFVSVDASDWECRCLND